MDQVFDVVRLASRIAAKGRAILTPKREYVRYRGSVLPHPHSRLNGADHEDDKVFLDSAIAEAARVVTKLGCTRRDFLVEIGSGQGRLAIGLVRELERLRYLGLDVSEPCVRWCKTYIEKRHPTFRFRHLDLRNARYNPAGSALTNDFHLPVSTGAADIVYIWGVLTNMEPDHLVVYAHEVSRMLRDGGRAFLTAYVEDNVPAVSINPEHYTGFAYNGPLHVVRYEREYLLGVFQRAGLRLSELAYHNGEICQSDLYFVKQ